MANQGIGHKQFKYHSTEEKKNPKSILVHISGPQASVLKLTSCEIPE